MFLMPFPDGDFHPVPLDDLDQRIVGVVSRRLRTGLNGASGQITVSCLNQVVVLEGSLDSGLVARTAGTLARSTPGVFDVCNALTHPVTDSGPSPRTGPHRRMS